MNNNTDALTTLRSEITAGWTVTITDHDYCNNSRDNVTVSAVHQNGVILTPEKGWSSQGRGFSSTAFTWDGDMEVTGRIVRLYHTPPPHTGKSRRLIKTFVFTPPAPH